MASIIKADNIQKVSDGSNIIKKCGSTITLGSCGATIALACGATQTGFGQTYSAVEYCTTAKTSPFTAAAGTGYFINTTCGAVTVTLPATPTAGDVVSLKDYASTWDANGVTVGRNGSKIGSVCADPLLNTKGQSTTLIYVDGTQGWLNIQTNQTIKGAYEIQYLVLAGGGGGGKDYGAGGGAGGYRTICSQTFSVNVGTSYPIVVGSGGTGISSSQPTDGQPTALGKGSDSSFSTITSTGGGGGGSGGGNNVGSPGGSGGGGRGACKAGGTGNDPPVSPPQGNPGANGVNSPPLYRGQGGGGAGAAAACTDNGAIGANTTIFGSSPIASSYGEPGPNPGRYFGGGGGAGADLWPPGAAYGGGGIGGGGNGKANPTQPCGPTTWAGLTNMGGGGGGGNNSPSDNGANGGSGIVVIRHATANGGSGGNVTDSCGTDTIRVFTADGTFTA